MKRGDLVKVTIYVDIPEKGRSPAAWPPPEEFIGMYVGPDPEYRPQNHLVMYDGGVWTTPGYQIEVMT